MKTKQHIKINQPFYFQEFITDLPYPLFHPSRHLSRTKLLCKVWCRHQTQLFRMLKAIIINYFELSPISRFANTCALRIKFNMLRLSMICDFHLNVNIHSERKVLKIYASDVVKLKIYQIQLVFMKEKWKSFVPDVALFQQRASR